MRLRVFGPPGTGKTTWLVNDVARLLGEGVPGEEIAVCSFSRAAFREFAARLNGAIPQENLGTIHSLAYRAIGRPELALTPQRVREWNEQAPAYWHISPRVRGESVALDPMDPYGEEEGNEGDRLYDEVVYLRNTLTPLERWPMEHREFWRAWQAWMRANDLVDFPGMLELALAARPSLGVDHLYIDEAQDLSPLQLRLVEAWADRARHVAIIGDDDQAIYSFQGADGEGFLRFPVDREMVLSQSYRVPAVVQRVAEAVAWRIRGRAPKAYRPRPEAGNLITIPATPEDPSWAVEMAEELVRAGMRPMFLASARYILEKTKAALVEAGLGYQNPYAPHRPDLNLFPSETGTGVPGWKRVRAYLVPDWRGEDVKLWGEFLRREVFAVPASEARARLSALRDDEPVWAEHPIREVFREEAWARALARDVSWLLDALLAKGKERMARALRVAARRPELVLRGESPVIVGTIHSVKGGEADWVFIYPGISDKAAKEGEVYPERLHRLYYVGLTRARVGVAVLGVGELTRHAYPIPSLDEAWEEEVL